jgi:hypothetical protein
LTAALVSSARAVGQRQGRRLLDDLLVAALDRALALAEVRVVAVAIGGDLDLDVARPLAVPLHVHVGVAEGGQRLGAPGVPVVGEPIGIVDDLHAAAAAAGRRLEDHRQADARGVLAQLVLGVDHPVPGRIGTPAALIAARALILSPMRRIAGRRPDPGELALLAHLGELGILGQEAVAGVDRVGAGDLGRADQRRDVEVALPRRRRPDAHRLIGELDVQRVGVGGRVDRDRLDAHLATGADDAERDLAAVGDQDLLEHARLRDRDLEQRLIVLDRRAVLREHRQERARRRRLSISFMSFIASMMHRTEPLLDLVVELHVLGRVRVGPTVERADERRLDDVRPCRRPPARRRGAAAGAATGGGATGAWAIGIIGAAGIGRRHRHHRRAAATDRVGASGVSMISSVRPCSDTAAARPRAIATMSSPPPPRPAVAGDAGRRRRLLGTLASSSHGCLVVEERPRAVGGAMARSGLRAARRAYVPQSPVRRPVPGSSFAHRNR